MAENKKNIYKSIKIFDLMLFSSTKNELLNLLRNHLKSKRSLLTVCTPNPEQIVLSRNNPTFLYHLQESDICIPDGIGLVWASRIQAARRGGDSLKQRIPGVAVVTELLHYVHQSDLTVLVIGGREYQDPHACISVQLNDLGVRAMAGYPRVYWHEGFVDVSHPTPAEQRTLEAVIEAVKPDIVFIAFGAPYQEAWMIEHRELLSANQVKLAMVVGGAFDMLLKRLHRAPQVIQIIGLEWLYRLFQEPWRWRRQVKLLEFIKLTFLSI